MSHSTTTSLNPAFPRPLKSIYIYKYVQCSFVVIYHNHPLKILGLWSQTSKPLTGEYENAVMGIFMGEVKPLLLAN